MTKFHIGSYMDEESVEFLNQLTEVLLTYAYDSTWEIIIPLVSYSISTLGLTALKVSGRRQSKKVNRAIYFYSQEFDALLNRHP